MKIAHYEVYADKGSGWQLEGRYAVEQRQEAFNHAKEIEQEKHKVKIIKEVFDAQDNSYQETVEYVSNLNAKKSSSGRRMLFGGIGSDEEDESIRTQEVVHERIGVFGAVLKLVFLIFICLLFANLIVSLIYPIIENLVPEDNNRPILFLIFFILFLGMAIPLILKKIPWYVFTGSKTITKEVPERKFYSKAEELVALYNLNDNISPNMTPAYPEAPLEYKQYVISFLSELLTNIKSQSALQTKFSKFGIRLIVYGGCLEMARYSGLNLSEANSVLYEAFQVLDGKDADLESFYDAKRSYRDNKIAVFMTGVGAYLMAHVINGREMPGELLNVTFNKWEKLNKSDEDILQPRQESEIIMPDDILKPVMVCLKNDLKFLDDGLPDKEELAKNTSARIRSVMMTLQSKYKGDNAIEANGLSSIKFKKLNNAIRFAVDCLEGVGVFQEEMNGEDVILRNCCVIIPYQDDETPNESDYLSDIFEHVYNGELVVTEDIAEELHSSDYDFEDLGEKTLAKSGKTVRLYKLKR